MRLFLAGLFCVVLSIQHSYAATSTNWISYAVLKIGIEGRSLLDIIREEGFILARVRPEYAAFSTSETRLTESERVSDPIDVQNLDVVMEFEMCDSSADLLSGTVYLARVRYHTNDSNRLASEIVESLKWLQSYEDLGKFSVVSSDTGIKQSYGRTDNNGIIEASLVIKKNKHYIELQVFNASLCEDDVERLPRIN